MHKLESPVKLFCANQRGSAKKNTSHIFRDMSGTPIGLVSLSKIRHKISIIIKISLPMPFPPLILKSSSLSEDVDLYIKKCRAAYLSESSELDDLEEESFCRSKSRPSSREVVYELQNVQTGWSPRLGKPASGSHKIVCLIEGDVLIDRAAQS